MAWGVLPLEMGEGRPRRLRFHLFTRTRGHAPQTKGQTVLGIISSLCPPRPRSPASSQEFPVPTSQLESGRDSWKGGRSKQQGKTIQPNHWGGVRLEPGPRPRPLLQRAGGRKAWMAVSGSGPHPPFRMKPLPWAAQRRRGGNRSPDGPPRG